MLPADWLADSRGLTSKLVKPTGLELQTKPKLSCSLTSWDSPIFVCVQFLVGREQNAHEIYNKAEVGL